MLAQPPQKIEQLIIKIRPEKPFLVFLASWREEKRSSHAEPPQWNIVLHSIGQASIAEKTRSQSWANNQKPSAMSHVF